jgi:hypothetical protein
LRNFCGGADERPKSFEASELNLKENTDVWKSKHIQSSLRPPRVLGSCVAVIEDCVA